MGLIGCTASVWTALKRLMAKRARAAGGAAGWALLFLSSGRIPPPPPASQIEVSDHTKRIRDAARNVERTGSLSDEHR
jgi:hypothetical protein